VPADQADRAAHHAVVIALSAAAKQRAAAEGGCDAFVAKPFELDDVLARVAAALARTVRRATPRGRTVGRTGARPSTATGSPPRRNVGATVAG
jgi:DNA-binding response OmpR family regulator